MSEEGTAEASENMEGSAPPDGSMPPDAMPGPGSAPPGDSIPVQGSVPPSSIPSMPPQFEPAPEVAVRQPTPEAAPVEKKRKRKIDLKSRLSSVRATGSMATMGSPSIGDRKSDPLSFPPPPSTGSVPAPRLPGGLPLVSSPFAPPEPEKKVSAQAQTIKVEIGEEVHAQRKKASKRTFVIASLVMVVGGAVGFLLGSSYQANKAGREAAENAAGLMEATEKAQVSAGEMSDTIRKAEEKLLADEWPADLAKYLKDTSIDYGPDVYGQHKPGGLPKDVLGSMITYANGVDKFQRQKAKVAKLLDSTQEPIEEFFASKKKKSVGYAITVSEAKSKDDETKKWFFGALGEMSEGFGYEDKTKWPDKFKLKFGRDEKEVVLFNGKDLTGGEKTAAIPLDPDTTATFSRGGQVFFVLRVQVHELYELIEGKESEDPNEHMNGIIKDGKTLVTGLKKVVEAASR